MLFKVKMVICSSLKFTSLLIVKSILLIVTNKKQAMVKKKTREKWFIIKREKQKQHLENENYNIIIVAILRTEHLTEWQLLN